MNSEKLINVFIRVSSVFNSVRKMNKSVKVFRVVIYTVMLIFVAVNILDLSFIIKNKI